MSVAFTKEGDSEAAAADLPDRPVSTQPNHVTATGLAQLDAALAAARADYGAAQGGDSIATDRTAMARAARELRYWTARRGSAQLVEDDGAATRVRFGTRVTFEDSDGRAQTYRIVGEDEADPAAGMISYVAPVARALFGKGVGDTAKLNGREVEIVAIASH